MCALPAPERDGAENANTLGLVVAQHQLQTTSLGLQRAAKLLQMSSLEFTASPKSTLGTNPFLKAEDSAEDIKISALDQTALDTSLDTSLAAHLCARFHLTPLPTRDMALVCVVATSLDDDSYLRVPLDGVFDSLDPDPAPDEDERRMALRRVQALDPLGIGARDVKACLALQLPALVCPVAWCPAATGSRRLQRHSQTQSAARLALWQPTDRPHGAQRHRPQARPTVARKPEPSGGAARAAQ